MASQGGVGLETRRIRKDLGQSGVYSVGLFHHQVNRRIIGHLKDPVTIGVGEITVYLNVNVYGLETAQRGLCLPPPGGSHQSFRYSRQPGHCARGYFGL